jgi:hypothetical protein
MESHYVSLLENIKLEFLLRFGGLKSGWFRFRNANAILDEWDTIKLDLIFDILTKNGLLSQFDIDLEITDKSNYFPFSSNEIRKRLGKKFIYTYKKSTYCDNYHDNYLRTVKEGELINNKKFNMLNCQYPKTNKSILFGSCRRLGGFECIDFITKKDCRKANDKMFWDPLSCNNRIKREYDFYTYSVKKLKKF